MAVTLAGGFLMCWSLLCFFRKRGAERAPEGALFAPGAHEAGDCVRQLRFGRRRSLPRGGRRGGGLIGLKPGFQGGGEGGFHADAAANGRHLELPVQSFGDFKTDLYLLFFHAFIGNS